MRSSGDDSAGRADRAGGARCEHGDLQPASQGHRVAACDSRRGRSAGDGTGGWAAQEQRAAGQPASERSSNFLKMFPDVGGYRYFLIEPNAKLTDAEVATVSRALESTLSADGFDVVDAQEQLAGFLAVQNTYLSTFQSLGALGLLLGTVGLAVVQLRSVLERRGELALMRAGGFRARRLVEMVVLGEWRAALGRAGNWPRGCGHCAVAPMGAGRGECAVAALWPAAWERLRSSDLWPAGWRRGRPYELRLWQHCGESSRHPTGRGG